MSSYYKGNKKGQRKSHFNLQSFISDFEGFPQDTICTVSAGVLRSSGEKENMAFHVCRSR